MSWPWCHGRRTGPAGKHTREGEAGGA
jgi:hypothetical protein